MLGEYEGKLEENMKRALCVVVVFIAILAISGCVTVRKTVRERVDQDLAGNRGVLYGEASDKSSSARSKTREYIDIRLEVPGWGEVFQKEDGEQEASGAKEDMAIIDEPTDVYSPTTEEDAAIFTEEPIFEQAMQPTLYKVKEGDSLGKIAKKFYDRASKWTLIYEANMDKIKDPQRIRPGIELIIPPLEDDSEDIK